MLRDAENVCLSTTSCSHASLQSSMIDFEEHRRLTNAIVETTHRMVLPRFLGHSSYYVAKAAPTIESGIAGGMHAKCRALRKGREQQALMVVSHSSSAAIFR
eukprot:1627143-Amphidinium_carterae.1